MSNYVSNYVKTLSNYVSNYVRFLSNSASIFEGFHARNEIQPTHDDAPVDLMSTNAVGI